MKQSIKNSLSIAFLDQVSQLFAPDFMTQSPSECEVFGKDWTSIFPPHPSAVVFPRSSEEISKFLVLCSKHQVAVVPSGGRTGLSGGAVAANGEVVLSLNRMNQLGPVDVLAQTVRVQAGVITEAVHHYCEPHGLIWPVDFASKGSSHVGGNISTNAGGVKVIRFGLTRNWVLGLQVVTMQGTVLELNGALEKNNTGVDLRQIFIGSEGTLGVITEATLKLARLPGKHDVFFFGLKSIPAVLQLFYEARRGPFQIMAFECLTRNCLESVVRARGLQAPFQNSHEAYVLLEVERPHSPETQNQLDQWLEGLFEKSQVDDGTLAQSPREAKMLWSMREGITEALAIRGLVHKNDIALHISNLEGFISEMYPMFSKHRADLEVFLFGHMGDGNLHVSTLKPESMEKDAFIQFCHEADEDLFTLVKKYQGSISAEHGIGLLKKEALHFSRTPEELAIMKAIKSVFDPLNLLNPGKIFDL